MQNPSWHNTHTHTQTGVHRLKPHLLFLTFLVTLTFLFSSTSLSAIALPQEAQGGTWGGVDWSIDTQGTLTLSPAQNPEAGYPAGQLPSVELNKEHSPTNIPWYSDAGDITSITLTDTIKTGTCAAWLFSKTHIQTTESLANLDVSQTTGDYAMFRMFYHTFLTNLDDLFSWDVSNVTGANCMDSMFFFCNDLTNLDGLFSWDVSNVTGANCMKDMFSVCSSLANLDGLSGWNISSVTGEHCMGGMFAYCSSLTNLDSLSSWDVSLVEGDYCMSSMFYECSSLTNLDGLSSWDVSKVSGIECMLGMFEGCTALSNIQGISSWKLANAENSTDGVNSMFNGVLYSRPGYFSGALNISDGFVPTKDMYLLDTEGEIKYYNSSAPSTSMTGSRVLNSWADEKYKNTVWFSDGGTGDTPDFQKTAPTVSWPSTTTGIYSASPQPFEPTFKDAATQTPLPLIKSIDYTLTYTKDGKQVPTLQDAGTYTVSIKYLGKYATVPQTPAPPTATYTIEQLDLSSTTYNLSASLVGGDTYTYTGSAIEPYMVVSIEVPTKTNATRKVYLQQQNADETNANADYAVSYANNREIGQGSATAQRPPDPQDPDLPKPKDNVTGSLKRIFKITGRKLTFDANGGSFSGAPTALVEVDPASAAITLPTQEPTREGFTFMGYFTEATGGTEVTQDTALPETDTTYYAHWQAGPSPQPIPDTGGTDTTSADTTLLPITGDTSATTSQLAFMAAVLFGFLGVGTGLGIGMHKENEAS